MCKLFAIIGTNDSVASRRAVEYVHGPMTSADNDGYGVMSMGEYGLSVKRWLKVEDAWNDKTASRRLRSVCRVGKKTLGPSNSLGDEAGLSYFGSIVAHARMATNGVSMGNVHPFHKDGLALVHNGVVGGEKLSLRGSDACDSMGILNAYHHMGVRESPEAIRDALAKVKGWYACFVMGVSNGRPYVDLFKEHGSSLFGAETSLGLMFGTKKEFIHSACYAARAERLSDIYEVKPESLYRFDALDGSLVTMAKFSASRESLWSGYDPTQYGYEKVGGEWVKRAGGLTHSYK